jgi:Leucine-rich repeat (LRR) protein
MTSRSSRKVGLHDEEDVSRPKKKMSRSKDFHDANKKRTVADNDMPATTLDSETKDSSRSIHKILEHHGHNNKYRSSHHGNHKIKRIDHDGVAKELTNENRSDTGHRSRRINSDKMHKEGSRRSQRKGLEHQSSSASRRNRESKLEYLEHKAESVNGPVQVKSGSQTQLQASQRVAPTEENSPKPKTQTPEQEGTSRKRRRLLCFLGMLLLLLGGIGVGAWQWLKMRNETESSAEPLATVSGEPTQAPSEIHSLRPTQLPSNDPSMGPTLLPSNFPSMVPSVVPTDAPSSSPTQISIYVSSIIFQNARFGGQEFNTADSYQQKAMDWIVQEGEAIVEQASGTLGVEELVLQFYALACLYFSTNGVRNAITDILFGTDLSGWTVSSGWLQTASSGGCDWYGVICNANGQVEKLNLPENELSGSIPPEIAYLHESLTYMDLYNSVVHNVGDLGNSFLGELTTLKNLYLGDTYFEYAGIPSALGRLTNLVELDISFNSWFGPLTASPWSQLTNLEYLVMNGHVFNTSLPEELIRLPKLEYLYAVEGFVQGDLEWISQMPQIRELWIDGNPFASQLPASIGSATSLASFSAGNCELFGTIPLALGTLADMTHMWLNGNSLLETIPSELGKLAKLETLSLVGNFLTGAMPTEICSLRRPFGRLATLEVDAGVACDGQCCTCCSNGVARTRI